MVDEVSAWLLAASEYFRNTWGLTENFSYRAASLYLALWNEGLEPQITSGRRSLAHQLELQRRWDAGDRAGLASRPATNSKHLVGQALDIVTTNPARAAE